jgi:hypothetical protein
MRVLPEKEMRLDKACMITALHTQPPEPDDSGRIKDSTETLENVSTDSY